MHYQTPPNQPNPLRNYRGIFRGFLAGLIVGMLVGWFFYGVVSFVVRFGLVLLLLIPLILVGLFLWIARRAVRTGADGQGSRGGMRVYTWPRDGGAETPFGADPRNVGGPSFRRSEPEPDQDTSPRRDQQEIIDLEFEELKRDVDGEKRS
jgi:hypothetical protein